MRTIWRRLVIALAILTIFPVAGRAKPKTAAAATAPTDQGAADLPGSAAFFPLVGVVVGLALILTDLVLGRLSLAARSAAELLVAAALTGGLHLDGLADTGDGLFSRADRERALAIMRDSRLGALGAVTLVSVLLLKFALLASLSGPARHLALLIAPVAGRQAMVLAIAAFPAAQAGSGLGQVFARKVRGGSVLVSAGLSLVAAAAGLLAVRAAAPALWAGGLLAALALAHGLAHLISRRLGGLTGDTYGATNEVTEVLVLLLAGLIQGAAG